MRRHRGAGLIAGVLLLLCFAPRADAYIWSPPSDLTGEVAYYPDLAVAGNGDAIAAWASFDDGALRSAIKPAAGAFESRQTLSPPGAGAGTPETGGPKLVAADSGLAIAVWVAVSGDDTQIKAAVRAPGGVFGPSQTIDADGVDPEVAMDGSGRALIAWTEIDNGSRVLKAVERAPDGLLGSQVTVADGSEHPSDANPLPGTQRIAMNRNGDALVSWVTDGNGDYQYTRYRPAGGPFDADVEPGPANEELFALAPDGTAFAVWDEMVGGALAIKASIRPPTGGFGAATEVSAPGVLNGGPAIAVDSGGNALVAWKTFDGVLYSIRTAFFDESAGVWDQPETVSDPLVDTGNSPDLGWDVVFDGNDVGVVAWAQQEGPASDHTTRVVARARPPTEGFEDRQTIGGPTPGVERIAVNLSAGTSGRAIAFWDIPFGLEVTAPVAGALPTPPSPDPAPPPPTKSASEDELALARAYRPRLFFDSSEGWRPLDVDRFLAAEPIDLCRSENRGCGRLLAPSQLGSIPGGLLDQKVANRSNFTAHLPPSDACARGDYQCESNGRIYSHVVNHGGYRYIDYWWYYRYNSVPAGKLGDVFVNAFEGPAPLHESDWEGMFVAMPEQSNRGFSFAGIASHEGVWRYLPEVLRCEQHTRRCSSESKRIHVYPANATHASYPRRCSGRPWCKQTEARVPEGGYDGKRAWSRNDQPTATVAFSPGVPWLTWTGNWNEDSKPRVASPGAPGRERFYRPWESYSCTSRWAQTRCVDAFSARTAAAPRRCGSWFGPHIAATLCDEAALRQGFDAPAKAPVLSLAARGHEDAGAPGVAQLAGGPLGPRTKLVASGQTSEGALYLQTVVGRKESFLRFDSLGLSRGGTATVLVTKRGGATLRRPTGRRVNAKVLGTKITPKKVSGLRARRRGGRVRVTFTASSTRTYVGAYKSRRGRLIRSRTVRTRPGKRKTVTLRARGSRYISVVAISKGSVVSFPALTRIR